MRKRLASILLSIALVMTSVNFMAAAAELNVESESVAETQETEELEEIEENEESVEESVLEGKTESEYDKETSSQFFEETIATQEESQEDDTTENILSEEISQTEENTDTEINFEISTATETTTETDYEETSGTETITENIIDDSEIKVTSSNSFGKLLTKSMEEEILELEQTPDNNISSITVEGRNAIVEFACTKDATLVVAIYDEAGIKMLASGKTEVTTQQVKTTVTIDIDSMPAYFIVKGYLVNTDTLKPLSSVYETPMYTKEMQELLKKTTDDFAAEKVINLDENKDNNFAVANDYTKVISYAMGENIISEFDDNTQICVIKYANEEITSLQADDIFVYEYEENEILVVKVADIMVVEEADGTKTATIYGQETTLDEAFAYLKIDTESELNEAQIDTSEMVDGVAYEGLFQDNKTRALIDEDDSISWSVKFTFLDEKSENVNDKLTGDVSLGIDFKTKVYLSISYYYVEIKCDYKLEVGLTVSSKSEYIKKALLAKPIGISPVTGVYIEFMPSFVIEASAKISVTGKIKGTFGYALSKDEGLKNISSGPSADIEAKGEVELFVGISLEPKVKIIHEKVANASIDATVGGVVNAKTDPYAAEGAVKHECKFCFDGDISARISLKAEAELNIIKKIKVTSPKLEKKYKIVDFYYSSDFNEFAFTACPHHKYLVKVTVLDKNSKPVITAYVEDGVNPECYFTDDNGIASFYLPAGNFTIKVCLTDNTGIIVEQKVIVKDKAKDFKVVLSGYEISSDTENGVKMVDIGRGHYGAISEDKSLYMWGNNIDGRLGIGTSEDYAMGWIDVPQKVMEEVKQLSLGWFLSAAVSEEDNLYLWGSSWDGKISNSPLYVMSDVKQVELCEILVTDSIAVIKKNGDLYMGGVNSWGRYGDGEDDNVDNVDNSVSVLSPKKIMTDVKEVSLGYSHNGAIKENGDLYTWGSGICGQLGNGKGVCDHSDEIIVNLDSSYDENNIVYLPQKVLSNVKDISFGGNFSAAITDSGELYMWGCNQYGNLGNNTTIGSSIPIKIMDNVKSVCTGTNAALAITEDGSLYVWGRYYNTDGVIEEKHEPTKIMSNIRNAIVSSSDIAVITMDGTLYVWGHYHNDSAVIPKTKIEIPINTSVARTFKKQRNEQLGTTLFDLYELSDDDIDNNVLQNAVYGNRINGNAIFDGLATSEIYNIYEIKSKEIEDILNPENLLYIAQTISDENGKISYTYEPKEEYDEFILFAVGSNLSKPENPQTKNIQDAVIVSEPLVYTGQEQVAKIQVTYNDSVLKAGVDYELSGDYKAVDVGKYTAEIKGIGVYTGSKAFTWQIYEKQENPSTEQGDVLLEDVPADGKIPEGLWIAEISNLTYIGEAIKPEVHVYDYKSRLIEKTDYTITYKNNTNVGEAMITVTGKGNYSGKETAMFTILPADISGDDFYAEDFYVKTSQKAQAPIPQVYYMGTKLKNKKDFTVKYSNTSGIYAQTGEHSVTITGTGNYTGTRTLTLKAVDKIEKKPSINITKASISGLEKSFTYTGKAHKQECTLFIKTSEGEKMLTEGKDYTVRYINNTKAGTATVIYSGKNGYTGKLKKTYKIAPYNISDDYEAKINYENFMECIFAKGGSKPTPVITFDGKAMKEGADYTLSYKNNKSVYSSQAPCVVVKGKGNFKGTLQINFTISPQDLSKMTLVSGDKVYKNKAGNHKITPKLMDLDGKLLSAGKDFDKNSITYTYETDVTLENGVSRKAGDAVENTDILPAGTQIRITLESGSSGNYTGTFTGVCRIVKSDLKSAKVTIPNQTYTGKEIILDKSQITVTLSGTKLKPEDFDIIQYTDNVKKGKASVTIRGNGNYGGTKTIKFNIGTKGFLWWWKFS